VTEVRVEVVHQIIAVEGHPHDGLPGEPVPEPLDPEQLLDHVVAVDAHRLDPEPTDVLLKAVPVVHAVPEGERVPEDHQVAVVDRTASPPSVGVRGDLERRPGVAHADPDVALGSSSRPRE
jgi:hypothetical protein